MKVIDTRASQEAINDILFAAQHGSKGIGPLSDPKIWALKPEEAQKTNPKPCHEAPEA